MMRTINGKLISHEEAKSLDFKTNLEQISINIDNLAPILKEHNQEIFKVIIALDYLQKRIDYLEENNLTFLKSTVDKIERKANRIFLIIMTISVVLISNLSINFLSKKESANSPPKKHSQSIHLIERYFV